MPPADDANANLAILYVDDDADIRRIVEMALRLDPGITLRVAASGAAAIDLIQHADWRPDVLIIDVLMPGIDGVATLAALRALPGVAAIPALFMTAAARESDLDAYRAAGVAGVIRKPFDPVRLAGDIRAALDVGRS